MHGGDGELTGKLDRCGAKDWGIIEKVEEGGGVRKTRLKGTTNLGGFIGKTAEKIGKTN